MKFQIISAVDFKEISNYEDMGFKLYTNGKYMQYIPEMKNCLYIEGDSFGHGHILGISNSRCPQNVGEIFTPLKRVYYEGEVRELIKILTYNPYKDGRLLTSKERHIQNSKVSKMYKV